MILGFNERTHLVLKVRALQLRLLGPSKMSPQYTGHRLGGTLCRHSVILSYGAIKLWV